MSMESGLFALSFSEKGPIAEGSAGPCGRFKPAVDATLIGVSFHAEGAGEAALQVDVDSGDSRILSKTIPAGGTAARLFSRGDFGYPAGRPPLFDPTQYPHITRDHTVLFLTNSESGTLNHMTVVFYFLAG